MSLISNTLRHRLSRLRSGGRGAAVTLAALIVAFVVGACAEEPSEDTEEAVADSPQQAAEARPDQLPLPEIMQALERDMAAAAAGLWIEDPQAIAAAARRVADHPSVTVEYRAVIQEELGDEFPAFVEYDQEVHHTAMILAEGAEAEAPIAELLERHHEVARGCVGCHTAFRSRLETALTRLRSGER